MHFCSWNLQAFLSTLQFNTVSACTIAFLSKSVLVSALIQKKTVSTKMCEMKFVNIYYSTFGSCVKDAVSSFLLDDFPAAGTCFYTCSSVCCIMYKIFNVSCCLLGIASICCVHAFTVRQDYANYCKYTHDNWIQCYWHNLWQYFIYLFTINNEGTIGRVATYNNAYMVQCSNCVKLVFLQYFSR